MSSELAAIYKKLRLGDIEKYGSRVSFGNGTHIPKLTEWRAMRQVKFLMLKTFDGYKYHSITCPSGSDENTTIDP